MSDFLDARAQMVPFRWFSHHVLLHSKDTFCMTVMPTIGSIAYKRNLPQLNKRNRST